MTHKNLRAFLPLLLLAGCGPVLGAGFESLAHHWSFDEGPDWHDDPFAEVGTAAVAADGIGLADATLQNGPVWVSGRQYSGLEFDGIDDSLQLASDLSATLGGSASVSFWIRTSQSGAASADAAPGLLGSGGVQWGWLDEAGRVVLGVDGVVGVRTSEPVNDGRWHHVVMSRDAGSGGLTIHLDGALSASGMGAAGGRPGPIDRIGRMQNGSPAHLAARLDQIHVFAGVIDAATIAALHENHAPKVWPVMTDGETGAPFDTASVLMNTYAYDAEQDELELVSFSQPSHGVVTHHGDGSFEYAPSAGFVGGDSFKVLLGDGRGGFATNTVEVEVRAPAAPGAGNRTTTFTDFEAVEAGGTAIALSGWRMPRAIDWDADGDQDLLLGHSTGVWRYQNIGTPAAPVFSAGVRVQAGGSDISLSGSILIALADFTGDGIEDLVAVNGSRNVRVYENTAAAGQVPVYAAASLVPSSGGGSFQLPDQRFDAADWDGDGLPDLITGAWSGELRVYRNIGTASAPVFDSADYVALESGSYNLFPRVFDLNRDGVRDYIRGINWGSISYWFDPTAGSSLGGSDGALTVTDATGASIDMKAVTDGAMIDFADFNGDGVLDALIGGHAGSQTSIAFGEANTVADSIAAIESIYDAHPTGLGAALEANGQALLNEIKAAESNILMHMAAATLSERESHFAAMVAHVGKYGFLQMGAPLDTVEYRHLPSIAGQNLMTMHEMLPDTPGHRVAVADAVGLTGLHREIYLQMGLHVGDNQQGTQGQLESIRDFMRLQPRESFPDAAITLDHYYGDGRGGWVSSFRGSKNTFNFGEGGNVSEWAGDLNAAAEAFFGSPVQRGDYFTFVMGHEVTHSLDGYISSRANQDLWRRKGQVLTLAAGPDVLSTAGDDRDFWNWDVTKARFQAEGHWDGNNATWDTAWADYWTSGPGAAFESLSFMRGNIDWFLGAPQEAMATQANHHWAHAEARLTGAIDRWQRGEDQGVEPMKANLTEVLTFLDWISCGMNKIVMQDTEGVSSPYNRAIYQTTHAWVERDDAGRITRVEVEGREYDFGVDAFGITTSIVSAPGIPQPDEVDAIRDTSQLIRPLDNDLANGGALSIASFTQPSNGTLVDEGGGVLLYTPNPGFTGRDDFTYTTAGAIGPTPVRVHVRAPVGAQAGARMETWTGIAGNAVADLTSDPGFPHAPDASEVRSDFEAPVDRGSNFGTRMTALVIPPATGSYIFWIATDDGGELWLGEDRSGSGRELIASVDGWAGSRDWSKFPSQTSAAIPLEAGKPYYLEVRQKEGGGGDNLAVAWEGPGVAQQVISGAALQTVDFHAPTVVQSVSDALIVQDSATLFMEMGNVFGDMDFMDEITLELVGNTAPEVVATSWVGTQLGVTPQAGAFGEATLTIRASDLGGAVATESFLVTVLSDLDGDGDPDATDPDDDGDEMTDAWEIARGLNPLLDDASADADGDGWSNLREFVTDTDPLDPENRQIFHASSTGGSGTPVLSFSTAIGRLYTVEFRDHLESGNWAGLEPSIPGTGAEKSVSDPADPLPGTRFYRLRVELP